MMSDLEFELIRRKRLLEMTKHLEKKAEEARKEPEQKTRPDDVLNRFLIDRAWEVLEAARLQHPRAAKEVENALMKLILSGNIKDKVTGEELYHLFHRLGFRIRLKTQIRVLEHGKLMNLEDKIKRDIMSS